MTEYDFNKCQCVCEPLAQAVERSKTLITIEIVLVVLVIIFIIIGLIIGFSRLKNDDVDDDGSYY